MQTVVIILAGLFGLTIAVRSLRRAFHHLGSSVKHYEPWNETDQIEY